MKTTETAVKIHPFEQAGLGKAPFRFVGMGSQDLCYGEAILNRAEYERTGIRVTTKPGGSCAYCGTAIMRMYGIESADGRRFHVGCECVHKTGDAHLIRIVDDATRKHERAKRDAVHARKLIRLAAILADEESRAKLATMPHPNAKFASEGRTLLDWADWMRANAGRSGQTRALAAVTAAL